MKILLLINWKIRFCKHEPDDLQPSDYNCPQKTFWFFKYFDEVPQVDVVDISAPKWIEKIENIIRFHFYQTFKIFFKVKKYDIIFIHGSNSAMLLCALKRFFHLKMPPILDVDISSFHKESYSGIIHRLSQYSSKAFDYMIYHTSSQQQYYNKQFPWLSDKSQFVLLGVDYEYWKNKTYNDIKEKKSYIVCVGYRKRDWKTLLEAYDKAQINEDLYLIGNPNLKSENPKVKVLPFIPIEELMTYIVNSRFSVIPLDNFNYSFAQLTLLQQMALGVPILAADVPAIRDYAYVSKGIELFVPYDVNDLVKKLIIMSKNSNEQLNKMGQDNIEAVKSTLSEQEMAKKIEKICNRLID